jgi:hypothetical protein
MKVVDRYEYKLRYNKVTENTNKCILDKENKYYSIHNINILRKLPTLLPAVSSIGQGSQLSF